MSKVGFARARGLGCGDPPCKSGDCKSIAEQREIVTEEVPTSPAPDIRTFATREDLKDHVFLQVAYALSLLSTCARRRVGAVFTTEDHRIIGHGYNGVAPDAEHCTDSPCPGAGLPSGTGLDECRAIHAEPNGLMYCASLDKIKSAYCTASPCMTCIKMIARTSATRIVFGEEYPHPAAKDYWMSLPGKREWIYIPMDGSKGHRVAKSTRVLAAVSVATTLGLYAAAKYFGII